MKKKLWRNAKETEAGSNESFNSIQDLLGKGQDISYACRLAFEEGPWHHAYSNSILINALLSALRVLSTRLGVPIRPYDGEVVEVSMHRPPHHSHLSSNGVYPVDLPVSLLLDFAGGDEQRAEEMIEALSEGAPHHVMANIITLHIAEALVSLSKEQIAKANT